MLAQSFLKAEDLGISETVHQAMVRVLGMFERGEIERDQFNMRDWHCGTAHCIGGWVEHVSGIVFGRFPMDSPLSELFYPGIASGFEADGYSATREQAAHALRNYLTIGEPRWAEALQPDTSAQRNDDRAGVSYTHSAIVNQAELVR